MNKGRIYAAILITIWFCLFCGPSFNIFGLSLQPYLELFHVKQFIVSQWPRDYLGWAILCVIGVAMVLSATMLILMVGPAIAEFYGPYFKGKDDKPD